MTQFESGISLVRDAVRVGANPVINGLIHGRRCFERRLLNERFQVAREDDLLHQAVLGAERVVDIRRDIWRPRGEPLTETVEPGACRIVTRLGMDEKLKGVIEHVMQRTHLTPEADAFDEHGRTATKVVYMRLALYHEMCFRVYGTLTPFCERLPDDVRERIRAAETIRKTSLSSSWHRADGQNQTRDATMDALWRQFRAAQEHLKRLFMEALAGNYRDHAA